MLNPRSLSVTKTPENPRLVARHDPWLERHGRKRAQRVAQPVVCRSLEPPKRDEPVRLCRSLISHGCF